MWFVVEFVAKRAKTQKLPEIKIYLHNKKTRAQASLAEAKARDYLFKNKTIPRKTKE